MDGAGVDLTTAIVCLIGIVCVIFPAIVFIVWIIKEYIKFAIDLRRGEYKDKEENETTKKK